ncbi:hypothetical protein LZZ85_04080 [Terrimonas sp. NA20]|uniref:Uncharacterized protein n=1 Tax=Terrimonas ginsenosidimutans TaxID=2908004 RepID=A0ABS9KM94_9BACT|nr:hypothetical protein [Terrimonas ginsenosidimutans]MCG2613441.1 hypothetical protein [Terrimonas ginsenosidimutans]
MMEKDTTILKLIEQLRSLIDFNLMTIIDYWEGDLCAIGLTKGDRLVYISTIAHLDSSVPKYDFDLEISTGSRPDQFIVSKKGRGVLLVELVQEIKLFLAI